MLFERVVGEIVRDHRIELVWISTHISQNPDFRVRYIRVASRIGGSIDAMNQLLHRILCHLPGIIYDFRQEGGITKAGRLVFASQSETVVVSLYPSLIAATHAIGQNITRDLWSQKEVSCI